mgnify:CR=1 FL=1
MATKVNKSRSYATETTVPYKRQTLAAAPVRQNKLADATKVAKVNKLADASKVRTASSMPKVSKPASRSRIK